MDYQRRSIYMLNGVHLWIITGELVNIFLFDLVNLFLVLNSILQYKFDCKSRIYKQRKVVFT